MSGAPTTEERAAPSPLSVSPLHFQAEENGTSAETVAALAGNASAIVSSVRLRSPAEAAKRPSARSTSPSPSPPASITSISSSEPSVSVPVLSTQTVSTAASASVALICCTSVSIAASRLAATASVTLISSTSPSGISVIRPAVAVCAASVKSTLRTRNPSSIVIASGIMMMVVAHRTWLTSVCSGEGGWRNSFASPATFSA